MTATHENERVHATMTLHDPRLVAKIIHLGMRHGCTYTNLSAHRAGDRYEAQIEFEGPEDGLRRLRSQIEKIAHEDALSHNPNHDKETS